MRGGEAVLALAGRGRGVRLRRCKCMQAKCSNTQLPPSRARAVAPLLPLHTHARCSNDMSTQPLVLDLTYGVTAARAKAGTASTGLGMCQMCVHAVQAAAVCSATLLGGTHPH